MGLAGVLRTRLLPPRLPHGCVARPRLVRALRDASEGPLVAVVAGAGYGKSVLLAQALAEERRPWTWCSCDGRIADSRALAAHLAAGIAERLPGFDAGLDLSGTPDDQAVALANALLDVLAEDHVIVIDDVHALPPPAEALLLPLVECLPPQVHLVLASRAPLPFPLARLRAARAIELGADRLALTSDESRRLLRSVSGELSDADADELHRRTEGWPAGLILAAQGADAGARAGTVDRAHFDYLAEEVLALQDDETQRFLLGTAALGRFSPPLAAAVTGMPDAARIVRGLAGRHLFTIRLDADGEWYRYHHLFEDVLRRRAAEVDAGALDAQHRRAAEWWAGQGDATEAVRHLLEAGDHAAAVEVLEPIAEAMLPTAQAETLAGWLDEIPRPLWGRRPRLLVVHGALLLTRARHEASFAEFARAIAELVALGEHDRAAAVLVRLQLAMVTAGTDPGRRIAAARDALAMIDPAAPALRTVRLLVASAFGYACRFDEARAELAAALAGTAPSDEPMLHLTAEVVRAFYVDAWQGHPEAAITALEAAIDGLEAHADEDALGALPLAMILRCYLLNEVGRQGEAVPYNDECFRRVARRGWGRSALGRAGTWNLCTALMGVGRWDELAATLPPPAEASEAGSLTSYAYRFRPAAALLAASRRDRAGVREQVEAACREMTAFGRVFDDGTFLTDLARAAHLVGLDELGRELVASALGAAADTGSAWQRGRALILGADVHGPGPAGDAMLDEALEVTAARGLPGLWTRRERAAAPALLARALVAGLGPAGFAEELACACGGEVVSGILDELREAPTAVRVRAARLAGEVADVDIAVLDRLLRDRDGAVRAAARDAWAQLRARERAAIRIESLGVLRLFRDGVPVPAAAFARNKARALLAVVLAHGGRAHREAVWEALWPGLPPERAGAAMRTTLHDLRRAVEPEVDPGDPSALVVTDGEWVTLAFSGRDSWDAAELRSRAHPPSGEDADARRARLRSAEAHCAQRFLEEWPYDDWAAAARTEIDALQAEVLEALAGELEASGEHGAAAERWRVLVGRRPENEGWQRGLMRSLAAAGDRAGALRQFHAARAVLSRELGIEPSAETRELYRRILLADEAGPADAPAARSTVTICFTDLVGSTAIAARLGDDRWAEVMEAHESLVGSLVAAHGGRTVKSQGDGVMAAFASAARAIAFAAALQRALSEPAPAGERLQARIGLHTGEAVVRGEDYLGRAVIQAARLCAHAGAGEILVSSLVRELVEPSGAVRFGEPRTAELKGLPGTHALHPVDWRGAREAPPAAAAPRAPVTAA